MGQPVRMHGSAMRRSDRTDDVGGPTHAACVVGIEPPVVVVAEPESPILGQVVPDALDLGFGPREVDGPAAVHDARRSMRVSEADHLVDGAVHGPLHA